MREWMITYEYDTAGGLATKRARVVAHAHSIREALTAASIVIKHDTFAVISIERQD